MESEVNKEPNSTIDVSSSESGAITPLSSANSEQSAEDWQNTAQQFNTFIQKFPSFVAEFWDNYKPPILAIGLLLVLIVSSKILFAILDAINDLPFLQPFFELIGIGYFLWFLIRYLLPGSGRQELGDTIQSLRTQVLGSRDKFLEHISPNRDE